MKCASPRCNTDIDPNIQTFCEEHGGVIATSFIQNKFYHFTASRFLPSIKKEGIILGRMLKTMRPPTFLTNKQWITINPDFDQSWSAGTGRLPYMRNEVRLTVKIPLKYLEFCKPWSQMRFLTPEVAKDLESFGDPENWYIFQGPIRPEWIVEVDFNPKYKT